MHHTEATVVPLFGHRCTTLDLAAPLLRPQLPCWLYMHRISISIMLLLMALARLQTVASICSHEFRCAFARESQTLPM